MGCPSHLEKRWRRLEVCTSPMKMREKTTEGEEADIGEHNPIDQFQQRAWRTQEMYVPLVGDLDMRGHQQAMKPALGGAPAASQAIPSMGYQVFTIISSFVPFLVDKSRRNHSLAP
jgi:hypothetical protein